MRLPIFFFQLEHWPNTDRTALVLTSRITALSGCFGRRWIEVLEVFSDCLSITGSLTCEKGWDPYGQTTKGNKSYSYYGVEIDSLVGMDVNLKEVLQFFWPANPFVKFTLTLPLRTSTRDSHSKTSGKSPRPTQSSEMARAQYLSCRFLIWEAVLYLI